MCAGHALHQLSCTLSLRTTQTSRTVQEMGLRLCNTQAGTGGAHSAWPVCAYQLDIVDCLLLELLECPLGLRLQGEGQALQGLMLAFHTDLGFHLGGGTTMKRGFTTHTCSLPRLATPSTHLIDADLLELSLSRCQWSRCGTG